MTDGDGVAGDAIVVHEIGRRNDYLFAFLVLAFAAAGVRGHLGAETTTGRIVVDLFCGGMVVGLLALWIYLRKHPGRLEISPGSIVLAHRGSAGTQGFTRDQAPLSVVRAGGRYPRPYLAAEGSEVRLPLQTFPHDHVLRVCEQMGWDFR